MSDSDRDSHTKASRSGLSADRAQGDQEGARESQAEGHEKGSDETPTKIAPPQPPGIPPEGSGPTGGEETPSERHFWNDLNLREWITAGATVAAALAAIASVVVAVYTYGQLDKQRALMAGQLEEMKSAESGASAALAAAQSAAAAAMSQADAASNQAQSMQSLSSTASDQMGVLKAQASAAQVAADAAQTQAVAAKTSADALTSQLAVQQRTFAVANAPHVVAVYTGADSAEVTPTEFKMTATFVYRNEGRLPANVVENEVRIIPMWAIPTEHAKTCEMPEAISSLDFSHIAEGKLPADYDAIRPEDAAYAGNQYPMSEPLKGLQNPPTTFDVGGQHWVRPSDPWLVPMISGCIAYRSPIDNLVHHTWFLYWVEERGADGNPTFIDIKPHTIPADKLVVRRWGPMGNSED